MQGSGGPSTTVRRARRPRWSLSGLIALPAAVCLGLVSVRPYAAPSQEPPADFVFVSDDYCIDRAGCDSVSVFDSTADQVHLGKHLYCSPGRLASDAHQRVIVSQPANYTNALQVVSRWVDGSGSTRFTERLVRPLATDRSLAVKAAVAVAPDGQSILAAMQDGEFIGSAAIGPFWIHRYQIGADQESLGFPEAARAVDGVPIRFAFTPDGSQVMVVTHTGVVYQLDTGSLSDLYAPLRTRHLGPTSAEIGQVHATIDPVERVVVASLLHEPRHVMVADLESRHSSLHELRAGTTVWGLSLNLAQQNHHMLAVHRGTVVEFYRLLPDNSLEYLTEAEAEAPSARPSNSGLFQGAMAWDRIGTTVITSASDAMGWEIFRIEAGFAQRVGAMNPCPGGNGHRGSGLPSDVLAGNEWSLTPVATLTASPEAPTATSTVELATTPTRNLNWPVYVPSLHTDSQGPT